MQVSAPERTLAPEYEKMGPEQRVLAQDIEDALLSPEHRWIAVMLALMLVDGVTCAQLTANQRVSQAAMRRWIHTQDKKIGWKIYGHGLYTQTLKIVLKKLRRDGSLSTLF